MDYKDIKLWKKRILDNENKNIEIIKFQEKREEIKSKIQLLSQKEKFISAHNEVVEKFQEQIAELDDIKSEIQHELNLLKFNELNHAQIHEDKNDFRNIEADIDLQFNVIKSILKGKTDRTEESIGRKYNNYLKSLLNSSPKNIHLNIIELKKFIKQIEVDIPGFPTEKLPVYVKNQLDQINNLLDDKEGNEFLRI